MLEHVTASCLLVDRGSHWPHVRPFWGHAPTRRMYCYCLHCNCAASGLMQHTIVLISVGAVAGSGRLLNHKLELVEVGVLDWIPSPAAWVLQLTCATKMHVLMYACENVLELPSSPFSDKMGGLPSCPDAVSALATLGVRCGLQHVVLTCTSQISPRHTGPHVCFAEAYPAVCATLPWGNLRGTTETNRLPLHSTAGTLSRCLRGVCIYSANPCQSVLRYICIYVVGVRGVEVRGVEKVAITELHARPSLNR
jgi:hypothetical protein